jgi:hypothetical protein
MIEQLLKASSHALPPPFVAQSPTAREITPEPVRSDPSSNAEATLPPVPRVPGEITAVPSTLADRMATIALPPIPQTTKTPTLPPGSDEFHLVSELVLTGCEVACRKCLGRWYVERVFSDGDVTLRCYTCRSEVTGEVYPGLADDVRAEKRRQREAEDAAMVGDATA